MASRSDGWRAPKDTARVETTEPSYWRWAMIFHDERLNVCSEGPTQKQDDYLDETIFFQGPKHTSRLVGERLTVFLSLSRGDELVGDFIQAGVGEIILHWGEWKLLVRFQALMPVFKKVCHRDYLRVTLEKQVLPLT